MADVKITQLPELSGYGLPSYLLEIVRDPTGTPVSEKMNIQKLWQGITQVTPVTTPSRLDYFLGVTAAGVVPVVYSGGQLLAIINNLVTTGTFGLSDELAVYQVAGSAARKRTLQQLADLLGANLATFTDPATGDKLLAYDASAAVAKAITFEDYLAILDVLTAFSGTIDGANDRLLYWDDDAGVVRAITPNKLAGGLHTIGIPAAAIRPRQSNGPAALATSAGSSGQPDVPYLAYDGAVAEYGIFGPFWMPKGWNAGTVKARFAWRRASGTGAANVVWAMRGLSIGDNESPAQAFGTAATVTAAASTTTANFRFSDFTGDCTIAGSPAKGDLVFLEFFRDGAAGGDTLNSVDAWLSAVELLYTVDARDDA